MKSECARVSDSPYRNNPPMHDNYETHTGADGDDETHTGINGDDNETHPDTEHGKGDTYRWR